MLLRKVETVEISDHYHAQILSMGLGLTWMIAPLLSIGISVGRANTRFVIFWVVHSLFVMMLLYVFDRIYLRKKRNK
jgi:hypothetical protein